VGLHKCASSKTFLAVLLALVSVFNYCTCRYLPPTELPHKQGAQRHACKSAHRTNMHGALHTYLLTHTHTHTHTMGLKNTVARLPETSWWADEQKFTTHWHYPLKPETQIINSVCKILVDRREGTMSTFQRPVCNSAYRKFSLSTPQRHIGEYPPPPSFFTTARVGH
jgi:hypothetical protein